MSGIKRITDLPESSRPYTGEEKLLIVQDGFTTTNTFNSLTNYLSAQLYTDSKATLASLSGNWQNTYTNVASNSANWQNTYTNVASNSANWQNTYTNVASNSANWQNSFRTATGGISANNNTIVREALVGDVTAPASSNTTTISNDAITNAKLANMAEATFKGRLSGGTGDPQDLSVSQVQSLVVTSSAVQTALSADPARAREASGITSAERVAFFDRLDDRTRYPEGTFLTDGATMPLYGSVWKWKKNDNAAPADMKMVVVNGALRPQRFGGGYLAAHATPEDHQDWSAGWFFTRELTRHASNTLDANLTITIGTAPLVGASTHSAPGNWHVSFNEYGIASQGIYETGYAVTVDNTTDEITLGVGSNSPAPIATGDYVNIGGSVVPSGTTAATEYWAILVSGDGGTGSVVKLATSRANAAAGTAVNLTSNGDAVTLARNPETINRQYISGTSAWLPPRSETRKFTGSEASDTLTITTHYFAASAPVIVEGNGLPGGLTGGTVYYVRDVTANTIKLSLSAGGPAINLTTDGSANQYIRGLATGDLAVGCMPAGRNNLIIFRRKGDYLTWELAGVGEITFYFRGADSFMGASGEVGFYYQTPPEQSSTQDFTQIYPIKAAWIDAPGIESDYRKQHAGYVAALATGNRHFLPGRLELTPENTREFGASMVPSLKANYSWATFSGAASLADATNNKFKFVGGNHYAEGVYAVHWSFPDAGTGLLGICPATFDCGLDATVANDSVSADALLRNFDSAMPLETGDLEEVVIHGFLAGPNAKRIKIQISQNPGLGLIFDSGSGVLDLLTTPFTIRFTRKATASNTHVIYCAMDVNGTVIGPQRFAGNLSMDYRYYAVLTTCNDVGAVTLETIRRTVHRNNIR